MLVSGAMDSGESRAAPLTTVVLTAEAVRDGEAYQDSGGQTETAYSMSKTFSLTLSQSTVVVCIGMDEVLQHHSHTFEKCNLNFQFQCEFSSIAAER